MLNIQKCMFVLELHCTLHSALCSVGEHCEQSQQSRWDPAIIFPKATQPKAHYPVIPPHQMLCSDWHCWKTQGISSIGLTLHHALDAMSQTHAQLRVPGKWLCWLQEFLLAHGQGWSYSQLGQKRGGLAGDTQLQGCPFPPPEHCVPPRAAPRSC